MRIDVSTGAASADEHVFGLLVGPYAVLKVSKTEWTWCEVGSRMRAEVTLTTYETKISLQKFI